MTSARAAWPPAGNAERLASRFPNATERHVLRRRPPAWLALLVGACGILTALLLPFAPVNAERVTLTWPAAGQPAESTTAVIAPYRPHDLTAEIPCSALRSADPTTVLATGPAGDGLTVTSGPDGAQVEADGIRQFVTPGAGGPQCRAVLHAGAGRWTVTGGEGTTTLHDGPVPQVFGFRTDLTDPAGLRVTVRVVTPFATTPTAGKLALVVVQVVAVIAALALLGCRVRRIPRPRWTRLSWIDAAVVGVLVGWAFIGPLAVDDGWATTIARNVVATGEPGNYYRWWNAPEVPFALSQQLLAPLTEFSMAPLWLRLPSTLLGVATWVVVSRGVLGAAVPAFARVPWVRGTAAVLLLAAWLPFNLGVRPESYVALGICSVLALAWRARTPAGVGATVLAAALTVPISPSAVLLVAPLAVFAPRLARVVRRASANRREFVAPAALLCCVAALCLSLVFADQTWSALSTATDWHRQFGPNLPWYREPDRYAYLLSGDQQGSAPKRLVTLLTVAMLPVAVALAWRQRTTADRSTLRLAVVVVFCAAAYAAVPSKWSYHLGAAAGVMAAFLTVTVVVAVTRLPRPRPVWAVAALALPSAAAALAFAGPNAWWQSTVYDVPWTAGPIRPVGIPLDNPLLWLAVGAAGWALTRRRLPPAPAVCLTAATTVVVLLVGSFVAAPLRRPQGSLARSNIDRLTDTRVCGLADDIEVLPDGAPLQPADGGVVTPGGFPPDAPPPDPPGTGTSSFVWGTWASGPQDTASIVTPWFVLPPPAPDDGVALSVAGRTGGANAIAFEFGRADGSEVTWLGTHTPADHPAIDEDAARPRWRSIGVDADEVPPGADRVRISALDGRTDEWGWLAFTGPRQRSIVGLTEYLADLSPVLLAWPQGFLFPCVRDIARVSAGVAETPRVVIESPRPFFADDRDRAVGGTFAALVPYGGMHEVPSRLRDHPEVDWGAVFVAPAELSRDAYDLTVTHEVRWGSAVLPE